jgi:hypothetical protein
MTSFGAENLSGIPGFGAASLSGISEETVRELSGGTPQQWTSPFGKENRASRIHSVAPISETTEREAVSLQTDGVEFAPAPEASGELQDGDKAIADDTNGNLVPPAGKHSSERTGNGVLTGLSEHAANVRDTLKSGKNSIHDMSPEAKRRATAAGAIVVLGLTFGAGMLVSSGDTKTVTVTKRVDVVPKVAADVIATRIFFENNISGQDIPVDGHEKVIDARVPFHSTVSTTADNRITMIPEGSKGIFRGVAEVDGWLLVELSGAPAGHPVAQDDKARRFAYVNKAEVAKLGNDAVFDLPDATIRPRVARVDQFGQLIVKGTNVSTALPPAIVSNEAFALMQGEDGQKVAFQ